MSGIALEIPSWVSDEKAEWLREFMNVENWPDPLDDGLEYPPGYAVAIHRKGRPDDEPATEDELDDFFEHGGIEEVGETWTVPKHDGGSSE